MAFSRLVFKAPKTFIHSTSPSRNLVIPDNPPWPCYSWSEDNAVCTAQFGRIKIVPTWNFSQQGLWIIFSNQLIICEIPLLKIKRQCSCIRYKSKVQLYKMLGFLKKNPFIIHFQLAINENVIFFILIITQKCLKLKSEIPLFLLE